MNGTMPGTGARQATQVLPCQRRYAHRVHRRPAGTDFDVALQRWTDRDWQTVGDANNATSVDTLTFNGPAGTYRYQIRVGRVRSGAYTMGIDIP